MENSKYTLDTHAFRPIPGTEFTNFVFSIMGPEGGELRVKVPNSDSLSEMTRSAKAIILQMLRDVTAELEKEV